MFSLETIIAINARANGDSIAPLVCPWKPTAPTTNDPSKAAYQDALAGYPHELVISDTREG
jgi:hypothetical protein